MLRWCSSVKAMAPKVTPPEVRFWAKVRKTEDCWLWTATKDRYGYGVFDKIRAHQFLAGKAPTGKVWDHLCRVRHCVRPDHLEAVDPVENINRGRQRALKTHCAQGHPWIPENIWQNSQQRGCKICRRERNAAKYAADPEAARQRTRNYYAAHREERLEWAKHYAHRNRHKG